jgi:hypothetical protein
MQATSTSKVRDPHAPRTFRRATTVIWALMLTVLLAAVAGILAASEVGHGFLSVIAPFAGVSPLLCFALLACAWPHVVVADDTVTVRNCYTTYRIPMSDVKEFVYTRLGLFILLHSGRKVPVTAYASGSGGKAFGHGKAAESLNNAIEDKMSYLAAGTEPEPATRTVDVRNIIITIACLVACVGITWAGIATYHA